MALITDPAEAAKFLMTDSPPPPNPLLLADQEFAEKLAREASEAKAAETKAAKQLSSKWGSSAKLFYERSASKRDHKDDRGSKGVSKGSNEKRDDGKSKGKGHKDRSPKRDEKSTGGSKGGDREGKGSKGRDEKKDDGRGYHKSRITKKDDDDFTREVFNEKKNYDKKDDKLHEKKFDKLDTFASVTDKSYEEKSDSKIDKKGFGRRKLEKKQDIHVQIQNHMDNNDAPVGGILGMTFDDEPSAPSSFDKKRSPAFAPKKSANLEPKSRDSSPKKSRDSSASKLERKKRVMESFDDDWWIDQDFPPCSTSLWASKDEDEMLGGDSPMNSPLPNCDWVRASEITGVIDDPDPHLFGDIMSCPCKGASGLGDAWVINTFIAIMRYPGHLMSLFTTREYQVDGRYTLRLFIPPQGWTEIEIDDHIPVIAGTTIPVFVKPIGGSMWALMLEKAMAKYAGSYSRLVGGKSEWGFTLLTGISQQFWWRKISSADTVIEKKHRNMFELLKLDNDLQHVDAEEFRTKGMRLENIRYNLTRKNPVKGHEMFDFIAYYDQADFIMTAMVSDENEDGQRDDGLVSYQQYHLLGVQLCWGFRLVKLRQPHGRTGWNGKWGVNHEVWRHHPEVAEDLGACMDESLNSFWMSWEDFCNTFTDITVVPVTLPVPRNEQAHLRKKWRLPMVYCLKCRDPLGKRWFLSDLSEDKGIGQWLRIVDEKDPCPMCRRAGAHTGEFKTRSDALGYPGLHWFPQLQVVQTERPKGTRICRFGSDCYRHAPDHHAEFAHPWLG